MYKNIGNEEFRQKRDQDPRAVVLDVRTELEWQTGIIRGAECIDITGGGFKEAIEGLDKTKPYLIYCRSGNRSGVACRMMGDMGFSSLYNLERGVLGWDGELVQYDLVRSSKK